MGDEESKSAKSEEDRTDDGEMDVRGFTEGYRIIGNAVWICSLLGIQSVADVVRHGKLRCMVWTS